MVVKGLINVLELLVKIEKGTSRWIVWLCLAVAICALGVGIHEVVQGKSPEIYLGKFLYAIVMPIFAGMVWWCENRGPAREREK